MNETEQELGLQFRNIISGSNIFTPKVIGYYKIKKGIVELSTSYQNARFLSEIPYGVTVCRNNKHDHDASKLFFSYEESLDYIESLQ